MRSSRKAFAVAPFLSSARFRLAADAFFVVGLFRAVALCVFVFYVSFYFLGRRFFELPSLAWLLSLVMGVEEARATMRRGHAVS